MNRPYRLALFASGTGSNVMKIIEYFGSRAMYKVYSNKSGAPVLQKVEALQIPTKLFNRQACYQSDELYNDLQAFSPDLIVLAGFLWLMPAKIIEAYPKRIINIHPALLPKFGGKGMYGMHVHRAVVEARETQTGITIHYVNEHYDEGEIILQVSCEVLPTDTPESIAQKVQQLEHQYFPKTIEKILQQALLRKS